MYGAGATDTSDFYAYCGSGSQVTTFRYPYPWWRNVTIYNVSPISPKSGSNCFGGRGILYATVRSFNAFMTDSTGGNGTVTVLDGKNLTRNACEMPAGLALPSRLTWLDSTRGTDCMGDCFGTRTTDKGTGCCYENQKTDKGYCFADPVVIVSSSGGTGTSGGTQGHTDISNSDTNDSTQNTSDTDHPTNIDNPTAITTSTSSPTLGTDASGGSGGRPASDAMMMAPSLLFMLGALLIMMM